MQEGKLSALSPLFPLSPSGSLRKWDSQRCLCWDEDLFVLGMGECVGGLAPATFSNELSTKNVIHGSRWDL